MRYFRIKEVFEILKFILLEEPILFFCEDLHILTYIIEGLISLIYPFEYQYPIISVLPEQNYSFISIFKHFIFGINHKYTDDIFHKKGISLDENLATYKETPIDKTFDNKERYTVEPCLHARAVVKLDNSDYYHYCDSNGVYFPEKGLNNIFYNNHSVLDYFKKYNYTKPANHASLLMYEIVN